MFCDADLARRAINLVLESGADFADFFVETRLSCAFKTDSPDFTAEETATAGVGLRAVVGDHWLHAWCDGTDEDEILNLARKLRDQIGTAGPATECRPLFLEGSAAAPSLAPAGHRRSCVKSLFGAIERDLPRGLALVAYQEFSQSVFVADSEGGCVADTRHNVFCPVICRMNEKHGVSVGVSLVGGGAGLPPAAQWTEAGVSAAAKAVSLQGAEAPELGPHTVVLTREAAGVFHEALGHALEARFAEDGILAGRIGRRIAPPILNVVDDSTLRGLGGSYRFDDEGTSAARNILVENGILRSFLTDKVTARKHGFRLTGNARRGSYRVAPLSRMSNTYVAPGDVDPGEIISSVASGILVKSTLSGRSGAVGGEFSILVNEAYSVTSGRIGRPLGMFTIADRTPDFLLGLRAVGNDLWIAPNGLCGLTPEQTIPVVSGGPTLLADRLTVRSVHRPEEVLRLL